MVGGNVAERGRLSSEKAAPRLNGNRSRAAVGAFLAAVGLLLFGLGQDIVSNLLADQRGPHVPPGLQRALALVGLGVFLGGLTPLLQRQLSRWAS